MRRLSIHRLRSPTGAAENCDNPLRNQLWRSLFVAMGLAALVACSGDSNGGAVAGGPETGVGGGGDTGVAGGGDIGVAGDGDAGLMGGGDTGVAGGGDIGVAGDGDAGLIGNGPDSGSGDAGGDQDGGVPSEQDRINAATETATTNAACNATALPEGFYWEIGDRNGSLASGTVSGTDTPIPSQVIAIASSSKWIYSTYVLEKVGSVRASDVPFLHFTSGWVFPLAHASEEVTCGLNVTVGECAAGAVQVPEAVGKFYYSGGHFQHHAADVMGLGLLKASELTTEVTSVVGAFDFVYLQTNIAGGLNASANGYAAFLRRMLQGGYVMSSQLGTNKVCASQACATGAVLSPAPPDEAWNYSLGHWVEDDPTVGDHAFSCAGALGFYPWIDSSQTWYGVLARRAASPGGGQGVVSVRCGRLIRQAWVTGVTVTETTPTPRQ